MGWEHESEFAIISTAPLLKEGFEFPVSVRPPFLLFSYAALVRFMNVWRNCYQAKPDLIYCGECVVYRSEQQKANNDKKCTLDCGGFRPRPNHCGCN
jgi:hypothetical protein